MTINGAITQLVMMTENSMMPNIFRPALNKVIETISELEPQPQLSNNSLKLDNENGDLISREEILKLPQRKGYAVNGWETYIRVSDISTDPIDDATKVLSEGQEIEAKFVGLERKPRQIALSIKAKDEAEEKQVIENAKARNKEISEGNNTMMEAFKAAKGE